MKFKRIAMFIMLTGLMQFCAIYGLLYHVEWAKNIILFMVWAMGIITTLIFSAKDVRNEIRRKGRSVPAWVSICTDLVILIILASVGRFVTAAAMLWQMACEAAIYEEDKSINNPLQHK